MPDELAPLGEPRPSLAKCDVGAINPYEAPASVGAPRIDPDVADEAFPDSDKPPSPREEDAARAIKSAVLGVLFFPLQLYTAWLLFLVAVNDEPLRPRYFWYAVGAAAVLFPYLLLLAGLLLLR
jgi:hypothetical protein